MKDKEKTKEQLVAEWAETRQRVAELEAAETERKRAERLLRIQRDLGVALGETGGLTKALDRLLEATLQIEGIDSGGVYLVDPLTRGLNLAAHKGLRPQFVQGASHYDADSPQARLVMAGEPVYRQYPHVLITTEDEIRQSESLRAAAIIPVKCEGDPTVVASLNLASHAHDEIPASTRDALEAIAAQIGGVIARARAEEALRESEERFRSLSAATFEGIAFTEQGICIDANQQFADMFGYDVSDMPGMDIREFVAPEDRELVRCKMLAGKEEPYEHRALRKDGTVIFVQVRPRMMSIQGRPMRVTAVRDITESKWTEETLRTSKERYRTLIAAMLNGFALHEIICDETGAPCDYRFLEVNQAFEKMTGLDATETVGKTALQVMPQIESYWIDTYGKVALTGEPTQFENYSRELDKIFEVLAYSPKEGQFATVFTDITALGQAESQRDAMLEALQESERKFRDIAKNIPGMVYQLRVRSDGSSYFSYVSPRAAELFGLPGDLSSPEWEMGALVHPDDREQFFASVNQAIVNRAGWSFRGRLITHAGELKWFQGISSPTQISDELVFDGIVLDITERMRAEETLKRSRERFAAVLDSLDQVVYVADMDTHEILFINKYVHDVFGDVVGTTCWQALQNDQTGPCDFCTNDKLVDANGVPTGVYAWEFQNTITNRWYDIRDRAIPWTDGRIVRLQVATDITERKRAEDALRRAHQELAAKAVALEKANAELEQYAYVVSHDIRAPLRAIHNYADFIREDLAATLDGDQKAYLDGLGAAVREAEELVSDLLELSRVGRGGVPIESVDVGAFLHELSAILAPPADVEIVMADDWPAIDAEPVLLGQIFQNLISNAIKFNRAPRKRVELGWRMAKEEHVELFVRDNGIGIDPRYHEQIFRVFERLHTREEYEGTGVGLAIVKKATDRLRGSVRVESKPGAGSTFFVTLPRKQEEVRA